MGKLKQFFIFSEKLVTKLDEELYKLSNKAIDTK